MASIKEYTAKELSQGATIITFAMCNCKKCDGLDWPKAPFADLPKIAAEFGFDDEMDAKQYKKLHHLVRQARGRKLADLLAEALLAEAGN